MKGAPETVRPFSLGEAWEGLGVLGVLEALDSLDYLDSLGLLDNS